MQMFIQTLFSVNTILLRHHCLDTILLRRHCLDTILIRHVHFRHIRVFNSIASVDLNNSYSRCNKRIDYFFVCLSSFIVLLLFCCLLVRQFHAHFFYTKRTNSIFKHGSTGNHPSHNFFPQSR